MDPRNSPNLNSTMTSAIALMALTSLVPLYSFLAHISHSLTLCQCLLILTKWIYFDSPISLKGFFFEQYFNILEDGSFLRCFLIISQRENDLWLSFYNQNKVETLFIFFSFLRVLHYHIFLCGVCSIACSSICTVRTVCLHPRWN